MNPTPDVVALQAALDAGPTDGPWDWITDERHAGALDHIADLSAAWVFQPAQRKLGLQTTDAAYIAACSPDRITRVLAALRAAEQRAEAAEGRDEWRAMLYAPTDGTEVELLLFHTNRRFAKPEDRDDWQHIVTSKWINFNDGGWTWSGMYGEPMGWRPLKQGEQPCEPL